MRAPGDKEKVHRVEDRVEAARIDICWLEQASRNIQQVLAMNYDLKTNLVYRKRNPAYAQSKYQLPTDCLTKEEKLADETAKREIAKHCLRNLHEKTDKGGVLKKAIYLL